MYICSCVLTESNVSSGEDAVTGCGETPHWCDYSSTPVTTSVSCHEPCESGGAGIGER